MFSALKKAALLAVFSLALTGIAMAADNLAPKSFKARSGEDTLKAAQEASDAIDARLQATADEANRELADAKVRDDYTEARRELDATRGLTYPGTPEYNDLSAQMQQLDRDFTADASRMR